MADRIVDAVFKRFQVADAKIDLLNRIAEKLVATASGNDVAAPEKVVLALRRLVADEKLKLPGAAVSRADFKDAFLLDAQRAIEDVLKMSGNPHLALAGNLLSVAAIKFLNNVYDRCGGNELVEKPKGGDPIKPQANGRFLILYWVEEDPSGAPLLPPIEGSPFLARSKLKQGFENWEGVLNLDVTRTADRTKANLLVTGRDFGPEVDDSVLALTDIGPPHDVQVRMVFDTAERTLTREQFVALAAHELGHALGIKHADVSGNGHLMSDTLSSVTEPDASDLSAAERHNWKKTV